MPVPSISRSDKPLQNRRIQVPHEKTSSRMTGMRKLPSLRALHAFEAAARHHSFAAAANELGVTPTAISHQIRQLEAACSVKLFQRRPRPLLLTSAGARLYPALRNGFDALATAVASLAEEDVQAPLRVTSPSAFASKWLVPQLPN